MIVSYINLIDSYTPSASGENANYPSTNILDQRISRKWRTTTVSTSWYKIDTSTGESPAVAMVFGDNLSTGATVRIQSSTNDFSTTHKTYDMIRISRCGWFKKFTSTSADRYWRFYFKDTACSDTYIEVGRLWLGGVSMLPGIDMSFPEGWVDLTESQMSISGQRYTDRGDLLRRYTVNIPYMTSTQKTTLDNIIDDVRMSKTFLTIIDSASSTPTNVKPLYGSITSQIKYTHIFGNRWKASFELMEAK